MKDGVWSTGRFIHVLARNNTMGKSGINDVQRLLKVLDLNFD